MALKDIFTRAKTPEDKLFKAVDKLNLKKVQELLAADVNPNAQNKLKQTALDVCVEKIEDISAVTVYTASGINKLKNKTKRIASVWNALVRANGTLNMYKDDEAYAGGNRLVGSGSCDVTFTLNKPPRP